MSLNDSLSPSPQDTDQTLLSKILKFLNGSGNGRPLQVGGIDPSGVLRTILTDADGSVQTNDYGTPFSFITTASNNLTQLKSSAGTITSINGTNASTKPIILKFFDSVASPTVGTLANAYAVFSANATAANALSNSICSQWRFTNGIWVAAVNWNGTNFASGDNTNTAAGDGVFTIGID